MKSRSQTVDCQPIRIGAPLWHALGPTMPRLFYRGISRRARHGDEQAEGGTVAGGAVNLDRAAVDLHDVFDNRQAQAGAAKFSGAGAIDAVKTLENERHLMLGDADAV